MEDLDLQQQSRSFSGYMRHLISHMQRMLLTGRAQGYTDQQLRELCRIRAATLRNKADEIEHLAL
jgi:hypothetical protein